MKTLNNSSHGIFGVQSGTVGDFFPSISVFPVCITISVFHTHISFLYHRHCKELTALLNKKEEAVTYKKLYLECCSLWIRNMDPRKKIKRGS